MFAYQTVLCYNENMKKIKDIVCENLISLRKENKLTQIDLAKKINYSDKAISRWEKGEVMPDYEVLDNICKVYGISICYLFEDHKNNNKKIIPQYGNKVAILSLIVCALWTVATIAYVYLHTIQGINNWQLFVWGVPITCLIVLYYNKKHFKSSLTKIITLSILLWTFLASIYLQLLIYNIWPIFFVGIPVQASIIVASYIKPERHF